MASWGDLLNYSLTSLRHRSMRSWLTVLGIVIGIAAIVSLIAVAQGLQAQVEKSLDSFGSRTVIVIPGDVTKGGGMSGSGMGADTGKLYDNDVKRLKRLPGLDLVSRFITIRPDIRFKDEGISASVSGIETVDYSQMFDLSLSAGRAMVDSDRRVVIIGSSYAEAGTIFKQPMTVGSVVTLGGDRTPYRVIGVLNKNGDPDTDLAFYIPFDDARELAGKTMAKNEITAIIFKVLPSFDFKEALDSAEAELCSAHRVSREEKDFSFITADFIREQMNTILGFITLFMGFVASISLLVGAVNVANTMFMTVLERTKEIGTLKAIGASEGTILRLFLIESGLLGLGGGILGALLGASLAIAINASGVLTTVLTWELILGACLFSFVLGLVSGFIPARNASKLVPVDALRFE